MFIDIVQQQASGIPLHSFMLEETTKQSKFVVKNKPTEPLPCVGSEVVVGYNPNEFYLMKSSELPVIEDLRHQKTVVSDAPSAGTQPQFTFVCMNEDGELIEETVEEPSIFLEDDEEQLLEQVNIRNDAKMQSCHFVVTYRLPHKLLGLVDKRVKCQKKIWLTLHVNERKLNPNLSHNLLANAN